MTCIATSPVVICLMASGPRDNSVVLMMAAPPRIDPQDTTCAPYRSRISQALLAQFFSRLQKLVAESRAGHRLGQRERAVHQGEQADCLFAAFASSINHLGE